MLPNLRQLLNELLEQFNNMPCSAENLDTMHILVDKEYTQFMYDPIILQKEHPKAPCWCVDFVNLLKYVFHFKEWVHTMDRQTNADFKQVTPLNFLIYTDTLLDNLGLVKKQTDTMEESEHATEQSSDDSFSHHSGGK